MDVVGIAVEGGRSLSGVTRVINYTGGGFVAVDYGGINLMSRAELKEWNRLGSMLNGSVRTVLIPLWTDPVAARDSDGDPAGGPGGPLNPEVAGGSPAPLGSTVLRINLHGSTVVQGGEWFAIDHGGDLEWRAYRIVKEIPGDPPNDYRISPPLREEVPVGKTLDFWRPQCLMRLKPGESLPFTFSAPGASSIVSASFVEAF